MSSPYGVAYACVICRKSFKRQVDFATCIPSEKVCPECGRPSFRVGRHFKAPRRSDRAQWEKVRFLLEHGFRFQKIRVGPHQHDTVPYPKTLEEAREFVEEFKEFGVEPVQMDAPST